MSRYIAILILFVAATAANAQCQSCQSCQSCDMNSCQSCQQCQQQPQQQFQPQVIYRPQPQQEQEQEYVQQPAPPVNPPLPAPPQPTTPPIQPPAPTVDPAAKAEQDNQLKEITDRQSAIEKSLLDLKGKGCDCGPKWTEINAQVLSLSVEMKDCKTTVANLVGVVNELKDKPAVIKPWFIRVRNPKSGAVTEYAQVNQGQYVTIDLEPTSEPALVAPKP